MVIATCRASCSNRRPSHKRDDVVCVFSEGSFGGFHGKLIERLKFWKQALHNEGTPRCSDTSLVMHGSRT